MSFLYGTELPVCAPASGAGAAVSRYDLAHAKEEIEAADTHTIPSGEQYLIQGALAVTGTLVVAGRLVVLP